MAELSAAHAKAYERLKQVRDSKTVTLKPCPFLKTHIKGFTGEIEPFRLRYYQVQGAYHLMVLKRMVLGDDMGLGKTVETITALAHLWARPAEENNKVLVVAPKSAMSQWASEIERFTNGVKPIVIGTEEPDPVADCTCTGCKHTWQTKAVGSKIKCPKCKLVWKAAQKDKNGNVVEAETIEVEREEPAAARRREYEEWARPYQPGDPKKVLIINYALLVRDWDYGGYQPLKPNGQPDPKQPVLPGLLDEVTQRIGNDRLVVIFDEAAAFKSDKTKTWDKASYLSARAHRVIGLTATLLKNRLVEGFHIYRIIMPGLFTTKTKFYDQFCYIEFKEVWVKRVRRKVPQILGYKNLDKFRELIDPFFLGRKKHQVSDELPSLTTKEIVCEMSRPEDAKYQEALSGILELGDGDVRDFDDHKALVSLVYCQQVVDSLTLLKFAEGDVVDGGQSADDDVTMKIGKLGCKEQELVDLLTGELDDEKVIVYTRFASLVPRLQGILKKAGVKSAAITGKQNDKARAKAKEAFQDLESDLKVIFITAAGTEAINLQAAAAMVFFDLPWAWGDYLQILGRMIRIGSPHQKVLAYHLMATRPNRSKADSKTIDHHVLGLLKKKRNLIDKVLGEGAVGALEFDKEMDIRSLVKAMQATAA